MKYYRLTSYDDGTPIHTGYNCTSKEDLTNGLRSLLEPQIGYVVNSLSLDQMLIMEQLTVEESYKPFDEIDYD